MIDTTKIVQPLKNASELNSLCSAICKSQEHQKEKIYVCAGGGCIASGSKKVKDAFVASLEKAKLNDTFSVMETGCLGPCAVGPVVVIGKDDTFYQRVRKEDVKDIIEQHLIGLK